jgi:hypothetical protein
LDEHLQEMAAIPAAQLADFHVSHRKTRFPHSKTPLMDIFGRPVYVIHTTIKVVDKFQNEFQILQAPNLAWRLRTTGSPTFFALREA